MIERKVVIPPALKTLQKPWFPHDSGKRDPLAETLVRAGAKIIEKDDRFSIAVGPGSATVDENTHIGSIARFMVLRRKEYMHPSRKPEAALRAYERLDTYLRQRQVELRLGDEFKGETGIMALGRDALSLTDTIIRILPDTHLCGGDLKAIELGGPGRRGAEFSEYTHGKLHMLARAVTGPKRNYMAILLTGMGQSFYCGLHGQDLDSLTRLHIATAKARLGVDYLHGEGSRIEDQENLAFFVAENYMHYVTQGSRLDRFIGALGRREKTAWLEIERTYWKNFDGIRYVDGPDE